MLNSKTTLFDIYKAICVIVQRYNYVCTLPFLKCSKMLFEFILFDTLIYLFKLKIYFKIRLNGFHVKLKNKIKSKVIILLIRTKTI